jgi:putative ABC transport system permease protein
MRRLRVWYLRFCGLFHKEQRDRELAAELESHLQLHIDDNLLAGMSPEEARRQALIKLGGVEQTKDAYRDRRGIPWLETFLQDVRFGLRILRKDPGFALSTATVLMLGIGANVAVFSIVDTVLLKPLNAPDPDRIVQFLDVYKGVSSSATSSQKFNVWQRQTQTFDNVSAYRLELMNLSAGTDSEQIPVARVSGDFFRLFGVPVLKGRTFSSIEDSPQGGNVVVVSYEFWRSYFGLDAGVLGTTILLGTSPHVVIGVLGPNFDTEQFDQTPELWVPFQIEPTATTDRSGYCYVAGRLQPGVTLGMANAELQSAAEEYHRANPGLSSGEGSFAVEPIRDAMVGDVRASLELLAGAVGFVLLIACVNVANLLLARSMSRRSEIAIRVAVGAGRARIIRQLLTESVLLSLIGGALGLVFGLAGIRALLSQYHSYLSLSVNPVHIPRIGEAGSSVTLDWRVLVFTVSASLATGILFGVIPAFKASRADLHSILKEGQSSSSQKFNRDWTCSLLIVCEVALTLVTLIGASLLIRTYIALRSVNPGFESHNILTLQMSLGGTRFEKTSEFDQLVRATAQRISALPGVTAVSSACCVPLDTVWQLPFIVEGRPLSGKYHGFAGWTFISPQYFEAFSIPVLRGRTFNEHDNVSAPGVVIINEAMAHRFWINGDPLNDNLIIGRGMRPEYDKDSIRQIIGIVGDIRDVSLDRNPRPAMYVPIAQLPDAINTINLRQLPVAWFVHASVSTRGLGPAIQAELREASGGLPLAHVRSMDEVEAQSTMRQDFNMLLMTIFAGAALLLGAVGVYGVMAYLVVQRTHEVGIRVALGASPKEILWLVLNRGARLTIVGVFLGVLGAFAATRLLKAFLYGIKPNDPLTFVGVPLFLILVSLLACYIPARKATRVDPMVALRHE